MPWSFGPVVLWSAGPRILRSLGSCGPCSFVFLGSVVDSLLCCLIPWSAGSLILWSVPLCFLGSLVPRSRGVQCLVLDLLRCFWFLGPVVFPGCRQVSPGDCGVLNHPIETAQYFGYRHTKQGGLRPTNPLLVQACLTACEFLLKSTMRALCLQIEGPPLFKTCLKTHESFLRFLHSPGEHCGNPPCII